MFFDLIVQLLRCKELLEGSFELSFCCKVEFEAYYGSQSCGEHFELEGVRGLDRLAGEEEQEAEEPQWS